MTLSGQCKGAGMIQPSFATMLCFVETDAVLSAETADLLLGVCVKRSFDRISVDGQLSTNDTAILIASGASGVTVEPESDSEARFGEALDTLLRHLALQIVRDGEGARARRPRDRARRAGRRVERTARAVANSPLVKTALYGGDANWGRIVQAVGDRAAGLRAAAVDVDDRGRGGLRRRPGRPPRRDRARRARPARRGRVRDRAAGRGPRDRGLLLDLGHEYIRINAEYTT